MQLIACLDMEGVLTPEIWPALAERTGTPELRRTTRDEPDYDVLMRGRIAILRDRGIRLREIQATVETLTPLPGAGEFLDRIRELMPVAVLSDTFYEFAGPLFARLGNPFVLCNTLEVDDDGFVTNYVLRQENGKLRAVEAFVSLGLRVLAVGDSHNDLAMLEGADVGILFRAPDSIKVRWPALRTAEDYDDLLRHIVAIGG